MKNIILTGFVLVGLGTSTASALTGPDQMISSTAMIEHIDIMLLESQPMQVRVVVHGYLPDSCTRLDRPVSKTVQNTFYITLPTVRPGGPVCAQMLVPFKEIVALETAGLPPGKYTVNINGITETFTLAAQQPVP